MAKRKAARRRRPAPAPAKRARTARPARKVRSRAGRKAAPAKRAKRTARPASMKRAKATKASKSKKAAPRGRAKVAKVVRAAKARKVAKVTKVTKVVKAVKVVKATGPAKVARKSPAAPARKLLTPELAKRKHVLDLGRDRRRIVDDDDPISTTPPSSLGLDRTASAARSGRQELRERYDKHTETSPALTGGDVDADWESAYSVGDEAPGGDNPTPDQSVVDDIAAAVGVEYDDNEELEGADKIVERDRHRWEFDPASSDDFDER